MYEEQAQYGGDIIPDDSTMKEIAALFDAYTRGSLFGVVVVWCPEDGEVPEGAAMAGELWGGMAFGTNLGKQGRGLGNLRDPLPSRSKCGTVLARGMS
jgi:hypothetical protein